MQVAQCVRRAKRLGVRVQLYHIPGTPGETLATAMTTYDFTTDSTVLSGLTVTTVVLRMLNYLQVPTFRLLRKVFVKLRSFGMREGGKPD